MFWEARLNDNLALPLFAAGAAGDLNETLRQAFARSKIGSEKSLIRIDDTDQREVGKMMAFRQHLRADENLCFTYCRQCQRLAHRIFEAGAIAVDARNRSVRKMMTERLLQPFRSLAQRSKLSAAQWTLGLQRPAGAAVMTKKPGLAGMYCHSCIAPPAFRYVAAVRTYQRRRESPPVEKHENLAACLKVFIDRVEQRLT